MQKNDVTVFLHMPKTGGTTLNDIFQRQYANEQIYNHESYKGNEISIDQLTNKEKEKIIAISGHYFYGIHEHFKKTYHYFTMLRHPVERVISLYSFLKNYPGYERVKEMTLEEYVETEPEAQNNQTILLCGFPVNPDVKVAKDRLKSFDVVGITEMFDESLFLLQKQYNWKNVHYQKMNITKKRLKKEDISQTSIDLIEKYNAMDIEIYEFAKKLLQEKLDSLTKMETAELEKFLDRQNSFSKHNSL